MHNIVQTKSRNQSRTINCLQNNQIYNQILQIPNKKLKEDKYGIIVEEDDYVIKSTYQPQLQPKPPLYIYLYI